MKTLATCLVMFLCALPALAAEQTAGPLSPAYLSHLACRIAIRIEGGRFPIITAIADRQLDTTSAQMEEKTVQAQLPDGRQLSAIVQHVSVMMPRDRFNVTMLLDGKPLLRLNHVDLDIFVETTVEGQRYVLHCFRDFVTAPNNSEDGS